MIMMIMTVTIGIVTSTTGWNSYKLHFVQFGRPHEFCVMMYCSVAGKPILYAHRTQAVSVEGIILRFIALPVSLKHTNILL
jgi:hypothetical protein